MAEQRKWNAKIKAKGTDTTGYGEEHARAAAASLGSHILAIVDLRAHNKITDEDGNETVQLAIDALEPVPESMAESVRELMQSLYRQRPEVLGQETLKGTAPGPSPEAALTLVQNAAPDADDDGTWDGDPEAPADPGPTDGSAYVMCDYPGCLLPYHEEGDHQDTETPEPAEDPVSAPQG